MLINRTRELGYLDTRYAGRRAEIVVLYGRRRVGKTSLLHHWVQTKPHLFFFATEDDSATLLRRFSQLIQQAAGQTVAADFSYPDWESALRALVPLTGAGRFVVVIDEFPRLVAAYPPITSYLQMVWDMALQHTQIFLVLTGSLLSVMRRELLAADSPLYLRHTWPFELKPLTVADLPAFFPTYSPDALIETYAILGGLPYYLISVDPAVDLLTNIRRVVLAPTGSLLNEIPLQLHLELQGMDIRLYMRVLQVIAKGAHTRQAIVQAAGFQGKNLSHYLHTLQELGLLIAREPLERNPDSQRWALYHLADPFLAFWHRYVEPHLAELEIGVGQEAAWQTIRLELAQVTAPIWEQVARLHLLSQSRQQGLPPISEVGSWWNRQAQLDVVGLDRHSRSVVFGEARWRQEPFTRQHLERLMTQSQAWLRGSDAHWDVYYAVYARNLAPGLLALAAEERNLFLFTPESVVQGN
jgi:AAA+ ATPase superfamily predicted ATPase